MNKELTIKNMNRNSDRKFVLRIKPLQLLQASQRRYQLCNPYPKFESQTFPVSKLL